jgi:hypothetical protein
MDEKIKQLEKDVKFLKEMIQLIVEYNAKQAEINIAFNDELKSLRP